MTRRSRAEAQRRRDVGWASRLLRIVCPTAVRSESVLGAVHRAAARLCVLEPVRKGQWRSKIGVRGQRTVSVSKGRVMGFGHKTVPQPYCCGSDTTRQRSLSGPRGPGANQNGNRSDPDSDPDPDLTTIRLIGDYCLEATHDATPFRIAPRATTRGLKHPCKKTPPRLAGAEGAGAALVSCRSGRRATLAEQVVAAVDAAGCVALEREDVRVHGIDEVDREGRRRLRPRRPG